jgi:hypothetical protein
MSGADSKSGPRAWRLQFSLRLLLVAFTAFAIGFPIWYRWPYKEAIDHPSGATLITTWQRQWGGSRVKHGLERLVVDDEKLESTTYRNGLRHGPYEREGVRGQFAEDLREGVWTEEFRTSTWHRGKLDGPMEIRLPDPIAITGSVRRTSPSTEPRTIHLIFADGRLTELDGKPVTSGDNSAASLLFSLQESRTLDDHTALELDLSTNGDFVEQPLLDVAVYLSELHKVSFALDPKLGSQRTLPITGEFRGIDLRSALFLITMPHNLGCDYRYGSLWITAADDCSDWHDPTGVADLKPPSGSALARAWNEPIAIDFGKALLLEAVAFIEERMAVSIDTSRVQTLGQRPPFPVTTFAGYTPTLRGRPLRDVLGHLLYNYRCRCELDGETLVILPPDESQEQGKATESAPATSASSLP